MPSKQVFNQPIPFDASKLADIQTPLAISFWPPAPGWWLLLVLILAAIVLIVYLVRRPNKPEKASAKLLKQQALNELAKIRKAYKTCQQDQQISHAIIRQLSVFLRRYALSLYRRESVASLTDQQWLSLLDENYHSTADGKTLNKRVFSDNFAQLLLEAPYQSDEQEIDQSLLNKLFDSTEQLINNSAERFTIDSMPHYDSGTGSRKTLA